MTTSQPSAPPDQTAPVRRPTALITGASGGLGEAVARQLAARGVHLLLVARREDKLQALATELAEKHGVQTSIVALDLADPGASAELEREVEFRRLHVDFLINNAGYGLYGEFAQSDRTDQLDMLQLNIVTLTELTHRFLPGMLARGRGRIMNVASTAAFLPGPLMATYYASKAFVLSFSEAIHEEVRGSGVAVTALCPGPVHTGFQDRSSLGESVMLSGPSRFSVLSAEEVARQGVEAMVRGDMVCIPGSINRAQLLMAKLVPRQYVPRLIHSVQRRK